MSEESRTVLHVEIPTDLHRQVKAVAALAGVSLAKYVTAALQNEVWPQHTTSEKGKK